MLDERWIIINDCVEVAPQIMASRGFDEFYPLDLTSDINRYIFSLENTRKEFQNMMHTEKTLNDNKDHLVA
jgi:hypothetical protein